MFIYSAFGLVIDSAIELSVLPFSDGKPMVSVRLGAVPVTFHDSSTESVVGQVSPGAFLLTVPGIARFLIRDGSDIIIDLRSPSCSTDILPFLLGPVFGILLQQIGIVPLHGSSILTGGKATLFLGPTGAGKSMLAATFFQRGHHVLADEICAVDPAPVPKLLSSPPYLSLWEDSLLRLNIAPGSLRPVRPALRKFLLPCGRDSELKPVPLGTCYILDRSLHVSGIEVEPIEGIPKINAVASQAYRRSFPQTPGLAVESFENICRIVAASRVRIVRVPATGFSPQALADTLERDFAA